jgi:hypothetical protein
LDTVNSTTGHKHLSRSHPPANTAAAAVLTTHGALVFSLPLVVVVLLLSPLQLIVPVSLLCGCVPEGLCAVHRGRVLFIPPPLTPPFCSQLLRTCRP